MAKEDRSVGRADELTGEWMEKVHRGYGRGQGYMTTEAAMLAGSAGDKAESGDCGFIAALLCLPRKCLT